MKSNRVPMIGFVAWTLFVWVTRLRNIIGDDDLSTSGAVWRTLPVIIFLVLAVLLLRARPGGRLNQTRILAVAVVWTVGYWLVRGIGIMFADHSAAFIVVHTGLMVVSIGLAAWAWVRRAR